MYGQGSKAAGSEKDLRSHVKKGSHHSGSVGSLLEGDYNEKESRASFQEALMEWRQMKPSGEKASDTC